MISCAPSPSRKKSSHFGLDFYCVAETVRFELTEPFGFAPLARVWYRPLTHVSRLPLILFFDVRRTADLEASTYSEVRLSLSPLFSCLKKQTLRPSIHTIQKFKDGGRLGIRTPGGRETSAVFKTAAINHSASLPRKLNTKATKL